MRLSAKTFAAMLTCLALTAFQFDLDAQSRGGSRSSSSSRSATTSKIKSERPSDKRRPDISTAERNTSRPSASKPSVNRPAGNKPPVNRPSVRPDKRPNTKPPVRPRPGGGRKPDLRPVHPHVVVRPAIGSLVAANLIARTALTMAKLSYYNNLKQPRTKVARSLASQLGLVQSYADASVNYYYQDGVFYTMAPDGNYYVIVPPAGALVEELPYDYETVYINGNEYFRVDNTLYQYTVMDGKPYFEVLGQLN